MRNPLFLNLEVGWLIKSFMKFYLQTSFQFYSTGCQLGYTLSNLIMIGHDESYGLSEANAKCFYLQMNGSFISESVSIILLEISEFQDFISRGNYLGKKLCRLVCT